MEAVATERENIMVQPISDYKILSFYHEAKNLTKGIMVMPRFVSMWLTNTCNLKCSGCWWMKGHEKSSEKADTGNVKLLIDELSLLGVESLEFAGGGESALHPDFMEIAEYGHSKGLSIGILTNGTILNRQNLEKSGLQILAYIRISLDYSQPISYFSGKGADLFEKVIENTKSLLDMRGIEVRPRIGFKFLLNTKNLIEMADMVALSESIGIDYVQFKTEHSSENVLDSRQARYADLQIKALKKKADIPIYGRTQRRQCTVKCFMSPIHAVIDCKGDMYVCCHFSNERGLVGNAFESGFKDVWFSAKHEEVIGSITQEACERASGCGCRWFGYNEIMDKVIRGHDGDLEFI